MQEKREFRGAIFDLDGTLVDSLMIWDVLWEQFGRRFLEREGFRPTEEADRAVRTMRFEEATAYIHKTFGMGRDGREVFLAAEGLVEHFYAHDVKVKAGVIPFLEACRRASIPLCIASATDHRWLDSAVVATGLAPYFDIVVSCEEVGVGKDRPDVYELALSKLGTPREGTWVFEDSLTAVQTAKGAGFGTVGIFDRYNFGHEEMERISDLYLGEGEGMDTLIPRLLGGKEPLDKAPEIV